MIKILNNLEDFCENCPYMRLKPNEHLGSGLVAYSCVNLDICNRVYKLNSKKEDEKARLEQGYVRGQRYAYNRYGKGSENKNET